MSRAEFAQCRKQSEKQKSSLAEALLLSGPRKRGNGRHQEAWSPRVGRWRGGGGCGLGVERWGSLSISWAAGCGARALVAGQGSW